MGHHAPTFADTHPALPGDPKEAIERGRARATKIAAAGLVLLVLGALFGREPAMRSYLVAWLFTACFPLGSLALLLLHNVTGGAWGNALRRPLEAAAGTVGVLAVAFLPILLDLGSLYEWSHPEVVAVDPLLQHKEPWLNPTGFRLRAVLYLAIWIGLWRFVRPRDDAAPGARFPTRAHKRWSGPGLGLWIVTLTFATIDWGMSLEPHWFSTLYGVIFVVGGGLSALTLGGCTLTYLARREPLRRSVGPDALQDVGNLLFAFTMLWGYMAFSQFLIIWSGNLAEEAPWYLSRARHGWGTAGRLLIAIQLLLPFLLLLSKARKRSPDRLLRVIVLLFCARWLDMFWLLTPAFHPEGFHLSPLDVFAGMALAGGFAVLYLGRLGSAPLDFHPSPGPAAAPATPSDAAPATEGGAR